MACNGYFSSGTWTWYEFPHWFDDASGASFHDPAVAVDAGNKSENVFVQSDRIYTKSGSDDCQWLKPPPPGRGGFRPGVAWVKGSAKVYCGPLAAWWFGSEICWAFKPVGGVWNWPPDIVVPGADLNPDVAARTGSHTMPVQ